MKMAVNYKAGQSGGAGSIRAEGFSKFVATCGYKVEETNVV